MVPEEERVSIIRIRTVLSLKVVKTTAMGGVSKLNASRFGGPGAALTLENCIGEY